MTDPVLRMLASLPEAEPDAARAARVRARCHARLARGRPSAAAPRTRGRRIRDGLLAGLGGVYFVETVRQTLFFFGIV